jgi:hypothetical protein
MSTDITRVSPPGGIKVVLPGEAVGNQKVSDLSRIDWSKAGRPSGNRGGASPAQYVDNLPLPNMPTTPLAILTNLLEMLQIQGAQGDVNFSRALSQADFSRVNLGEMYRSLVHAETLAIFPDNHLDDSYRFKIYAMRGYTERELAKFSNQAGHLAFAKMYFQRAAIVAPDEEKERYQKLAR